MEDVWYCPLCQHPNALHTCYRGRRDACALCHARPDAHVLQPEDVGKTLHAYHRQMRVGTEAFPTEEYPPLRGVVTHVDGAKFSMRTDEGVELEGLTNPRMRVVHSLADLPEYQTTDAPPLEEEYQREEEEYQREVLRGLEEEDWEEDEAYQSNEDMEYQSTSHEKEYQSTHDEEYQSAIFQGMGEEYQSFRSVEEDDEYDVSRMSSDSEDEGDEDLAKKVAAAMTKDDMLVDEYYERLDAAAEEEAAAAAVHEKDAEGLVAYERQRKANIASNNAILASLGLEKEPLPPKAPRKRKAPAVPVDPEEAARKKALTAERKAKQQMEADIRAAQRLADKMERGERAAAKKAKEKAATQMAQEAARIERQEKEAEERAERKEERKQQTAEAQEARKELHAANKAALAAQYDHVWWKPEHPAPKKLDVTLGQLPAKLTTTMAPHLEALRDGDNVDPFTSQPIYHNVGLASGTGRYERHLGWTPRVTVQGQTFWNGRTEYSDVGALISAAALRDARLQDKRTAHDWVQYMVEQNFLGQGDAAADRWIAEADDLSVLPVVRKHTGRTKRVTTKKVKTGKKKTEYLPGPNANREAMAQQGVFHEGPRAQRAVAYKPKEGEEEDAVLAVAVSAIPMPEPSWTVADDDAPVDADATLVMSTEDMEREYDMLDG